MKKSLTNQITEAVADAEETNIQQLDMVIQNYVSTDAIHDLVKHKSDSWRLQFETQNHVVEVMGDNTVVVDGKERHMLV